MEIRDITRALDHTLTAGGVSRDALREHLDDAVKYTVASALILPAYVREAREYAGSAVTIGTMIGFPDGVTSTAEKMAETEAAINDGADELDLVIGTGRIKSGSYGEIEDEIRKIRLSAGDKVLKVTIEAALLSDEEKIRMCGIITECGADYIKTATGLRGGALAQDILLFAAHIGSGVFIEAAGGISTLEDARRFLSLGAHRIASSRIIGTIRAIF